MVKKDFMSISEYKKALTEPKKPALELRPVNTAKSVKEPAIEPTTTDDDYEMYKLEWFIEQGMNIYDIVESIVQYAVDTNQIRALAEDSAKVVMEWESSGFGDDIYADYDTWLKDETETFDKESGKTQDIKRLDSVQDIIDLFDAGFAADDVENMGYPVKDVELAVQYYNAMTVGSKR